VRRICVYCGSNRGQRPEYAAAAVRLASELVRRGLELVYGGSSKGIMGVLADAVLDRGGTAIGVMPHSLVRKEVAHDGLHELHVTETMHERKAMMAGMSDGFVALPGGFGTLEEIVEIVTWGQLGFHSKPCGLLNVAGYYDQFMNHMTHAVDEGFLRDAHRRMLLVAADPSDLLDEFEAYAAPKLEKWVD